MRKPRRPTENQKQIMNCGVILASMSMTLDKVAKELIELDPNEWYARFLFYVDRVATTADVLREVWEQNREELDHMSLEIPSYMVAIKSDPEKSLEEVFAEMLKSTSVDTDFVSVPPSIDDLPF